MVPDPVHTDPALLAAAGPVDMVLPAVKALQNCVEQVERVQPLCPTSAVVPAVLGFNAQTQPGRGPGRGGQSDPGGPDQLDPDRPGNRRRLEWDLLNGVIVRKARAHGLPTPIGDVPVPLLAAASDGPG